MANEIETSSKNIKPRINLHHNRYIEWKLKILLLMALNGFVFNIITLRSAQNINPQYTHSFCNTKKNETMLPAPSIPILQESPSNYYKLQVCLRVLFFEALLCQY